MTSTQQPYQAQPQMTVSGGNRNPANKPLNANGKREWTHGLCDCFGDCGTFCIGCFCPCMVYQSNKSRRHALERGAPHPQGGDYIGQDCFIYSLIEICVGVGCILQIGERSATRDRYNIEGGGCVDCMTACCCIPCALTQESRELEGEEMSFTDLPKA